MKSILFAFLIAVFFLQNLQAGVIVVVKNGRVERKDEKGAYKGIVGNSGAVAAATDGEIIAVLYDNGRVIRYDAQGAYKGMVGTSGATAVQVSASQIIITYSNGQTMRYDAISGSYKGIL